MIPLRANQALVAEEILLDGRLALFHKTERWLAIADVHFGYELSQRAAGRLVPLWGMATISDRLDALGREYKPERLIILGDLVHDKTAVREAAQLLRTFVDRCGGWRRSRTGWTRWCANTNRSASLFWA